MDLSIKPQRDAHLIIITCRIFYIIKYAILSHPLLSIFTIVVQFTIVSCLDSWNNFLIFLPFFPLQLYYKQQSKWYFIRPHYHIFKILSMFSTAFRTKLIPYKVSQTLNDLTSSFPIFWEVSPFLVYSDDAVLISVLQRYQVFSYLYIQWSFCLRCSSLPFKLVSFFSSA